MKGWLILGIGAMAIFLLGGKCLPDGNSGSTGGGDLAANCVGLSNAPGNFAFAPSAVVGEISKRVWVVDGTALLSPYDVEVVPPVLPDDPDPRQRVGPPYNMDGGQPDQGTPVFEEIVFFQHPAFEDPAYPPARSTTPPDPLPSVGLLTTSGYDHVLFFDPTDIVDIVDIVQSLFTVSVTVDSSKDPGDYLNLPNPGNTRTRRGIATLTCIHPPAVTANSLLEKNFDSGNEICAAGEASSFYARTQTGAVLTDDYLFVSTSNEDEATGASHPFDVYFPGTVLVYSIDDDDPAVRPIFEPIAEIQLYGFNPTHLDVVDVNGGGADFILVTVSGADESDAVPVDANHVLDDGQRQAAIEVIRISDQSLMARYPLGAADLSPTGLAISPTQEVAVAGSRAGRHLMAVDLAALVPLVSGAAEVPPKTLDPEYVYRDASNPLQIPHRKDGVADVQQYPGSIGGVAINHAETHVIATDEHDGTVTAIPLSSVISGSNAGQNFIAFAAPIDSTSTTEPRLPGAVEVRPGDPATYAADVFVLTSQPGGNLCAVNYQGAP